MCVGEDKIAAIEAREIDKRDPAVSERASYRWGPSEREIGGTGQAADHASGIEAFNAASKASASRCNGSFFLARHASDGGSRCHWWPNAGVAAGGAL